MKNFINIKSIKKENKDRRFRAIWILKRLK